MLSISYLDILNNLRKGKPNRSELNLLIEYTSGIAYRIAFSKYLSTLKKYFETDSLIKDFAFDSIVPLFVIKSDHSETGLERSLKNWNLEIINERDACFFLYKVAVSRVEQEFIRLLKDADPHLKILYKTFEYYIKKCGFYKTSFFGTTYIQKTENNNINGKFIPSEELNNISLKYFIGNPDIVIKNIFNYIKDETEYLPLIPLKALILKLKDLNSENYSGAGGGNVEEEIYIEKVSVERIIKDGLNIVYNKLSEYVYKNKLELEEAGNLKLTLNDIAVDLADGGINRGLYNYLEPHVEALNKSLYEKKYYPVLDYMVRILKENIKKDLEVEFKN